MTAQWCKTCKFLSESVMNDGNCVTCWCNAMDAKEGITYRWFLTLEATGIETEVTKEQWIKAERSAGFNNTLGHDEEPATAGFSGNGIKGRQERVKP